MRFLALCLIFSTIVTNYCNAYITQSSLMGLFTKVHPQLSGITWGNWGSRPYEYAWASNIVSVHEKMVIDLGVGLPSQYTWYKYVINTLKPTFYAGIDVDERIKKELEHGKHYEIKHMDMAELAYPSQTFDVAYCISTYEHIPYNTFMKSIQETHRVLKDDGILVVTLDEHWDEQQSHNYYNGWNILEQSLIQLNYFDRSKHSFGLPAFLDLIKDYFVPVLENLVIDTYNNKIYDSTSGCIYYERISQDESILHSDPLINSCVSYVVLKKVIS